jgi:hypothetical protein
VGIRRRRPESSIDPRQLAAALAGVRLGMGTGLVVAPGTAARAIVGPGGDTPGARVLGRLLGGRDLLLAVATLLAVADGRPVGRLTRAGAAADGGDAVALVLAARSLPPGRRVVLPLLAGGAAAAGWWVGRQLG